MTLDPLTCSPDELRQMAAQTLLPKDVWPHKWRWVRRKKGNAWRCPQCKSEHGPGTKEDPLPMQGCDRPDPDPRDWAIIASELEKLCDLDKLEDAIEATTTLGVVHSQFHWWLQATPLDRVRVCLKALQAGEQPQPRGWDDSRPDKRDTGERTEFCG